MVAFNTEIHQMIPPTPCHIVRYLLYHSGSGYECQPDSCDVVNNCDANARCEFDRDTRRYLCMCNEGYQGDGYQCVVEGE